MQYFSKLSDKTQEITVEKINKILQKPKNLEKVSKFLVMAKSHWIHEQIDGEKQLYQFISKQIIKEIYADFKSSLKESKRDKIKMSHIRYLFASNTELQAVVTAIEIDNERMHTLLVNYTRYQFENLVRG